MKCIIKDKGLYLVLLEATVIRVLYTYDINSFTLAWYSIFIQGWCCNTRSYILHGILFFIQGWCCNTRSYIFFIFCFNTVLFSGLCCVPLQLFYLKLRDDDVFTVSLPLSLRVGNTGSCSDKLKVMEEVAFCIQIDQPTEKKVLKSCVLRGQGGIFVIIESLGYRQIARNVAWCRICIT